MSALKQPTMAINVEPTDLQARLNKVRQAKGFSPVVHSTQKTQYPIVQAANEQNDLSASGSRPVQSEKNQNAPIWIAGEQLASAMNIELVRDQYNDFRAMIQTGRRLEVPKLDSEEVYDLIVEHIYKSGGKPTKTVTDLALTALRIAAKKSTMKISVCVRVHTRTNDDGNSEHLLDLGLEDGSMVIATALGWRIEQNTDVAFLRPAAACAIPKVFASPKDAYDCLVAWLKRMRIDPERHLMLIALLVDWFRSNVPHVLLDCVGPAGSGKTTLLENIAAVIDPTGDGKLVMSESSHKEIGALATKRYLFTVDNSGVIKPEAQNLLCSVVYGTNISSRELFTNHGVASITVHKPIGVSSVNPAITQTDLMERALRIDFRPRSSYKPDVSLTELQRGEMLGAFLTLLVAALQHQNPDAESGHRMAKYANLGEGLAQSLGYIAGHFSAAYGSVKNGVARDYSEGDPVSSGVDLFLQSQMKNAVVTDTLPAWREIAKNKGFIIYKSDGSYLAGYTPDGLRLGASMANNKAHRVFSDRALGFPANARAFSSAMNLKLPVITALGYQVVLNRLGPPGIKQRIFLFVWKDKQSN